MASLPFAINLGRAEQDTHWHFYGSLERDGGLGCTNQSILEYRRLRRENSTLNIKFNLRIFMWDELVNKRTEALISKVLDSVSSETFKEVESEFFNVDEIQNFLDPGYFIKCSAEFGTVHTNLVFTDQERGYQFIEGLPGDTLMAIGFPTIDCRIGKLCNISEVVEIRGELLENEMVSTPPEWYLVFNYVLNQLQHSEL